MKEKSADILIVTDEPQESCTCNTVSGQIILLPIFNEILGFTQVEHEVIEASV